MLSQTQVCTVCQFVVAGLHSAVYADEQQLLGTEVEVGIVGVVARHHIAYTSEAHEVGTVPCHSMTAAVPIIIIGVNNQRVGHHPVEFCRLLTHYISPFALKRPLHVVLIQARCCVALHERHLFVEYQCPCEQVISTSVGIEISAVDAVQNAPCAVGRRESQVVSLFYRRHPHVPARCQCCDANGCRTNKHQFGDVFHTLHISMYSFSAAQETQ